MPLLQAALAGSTAQQAHLRRQLEQQAAERQQLQADLGLELARQTAENSRLLADHEELQDEFEVVETRHTQLQVEYGMLKKDSEERQAELLNECEELKAESDMRQARVLSLIKRLWQVGLKWRVCSSFEGYKVCGGGCSTA